MKVTSIFLLITLSFTAISLQAQRKPKIKGNREVTQVTESLPPFSGLELTDDLEIVLKRSAEEGYSITADDNLIDIIKFKVNDGTLVISAFYEITSKKELSIVVNYNQLNSIILTDGRLSTGEGEKINSDVLNVKSTGSSRLNLDGEVGQLNVVMQDNSKGDYTISADSLSVTMQNKSDAAFYLNAFKGKAAVSDNSTLTLEGTSGTMDVTSVGDGKLLAMDLEVGTLNAEVSGSSEARLYATELLRISLSGTARCYLFGDPAITLSSFKDSAEFYKRNK